MEQVVSCERSAVRGGLVCLIVLLSACAPVKGYPTDPTKSLAASDQALRMQYYEEATTPLRRQSIRDEIVSDRITGYEAEYSDFKRRLNGDGNAINLGSDLVVLSLTGIAATSGSLTTAAALAAASAGVIGARAAINADLYYQRTLPALLAQMDANRARAKLPIFRGLSRPALEYSLAMALADLDALRDAGGIPSAIGSITEQAETTKALEEEALRTVHGVPATSAATWLLNYVSDPSQTAAERRRRRNEVETVAASLGFPPADATTVVNDNTPPGLARIEQVAAAIRKKLGQ